MARRSLSIILLLLIGIAAFAQYRETLSFGFNYDDYHLVRPYATSEVLAAFHGTWDPNGIERPFYRPLTVAFYAARFTAFRYNSWKYHALSLALFVIAGALGMLLVARLTESISAALWFAAFWCVHPNLPISLVAWITNQMHLLQTITCLAALVWWTYVKHKPLVWWTPLLVLQVVALGIKEDGILLLPFVLAVHGLYWLIVARVDRRSVTRLSPWALLIAAIVIVALLLWRRHALGGLGGYRVSWEEDTLLANLTKGLTRSVLLRPARTLTLQLQAWYVAAVIVAGALVASYRYRYRSDSRSRIDDNVLDGSRGGSALFAICVGLGMAFTFNLPFALVTKAEQYYLLATGAILAIAAAADILSRAAGWWSRAAMIAVSLPIVFAMHRTAVDAAELYAPTSDVTRSTDAIVREWAAVPLEIRDWLAKKTVPPNTGDLARDLPAVIHGAYDTEHDRSGRAYRWTTDHVTAFINARCERVTFSLQALMIERPPRPFVVRVLLEGQTVASATLEPDAEHAFNIELPPSHAQPQSHGRASSDMTKLEILVDHTWTPGPGDRRTLGVKLYDFSASTNNITSPMTNPAIN